MQFLANFPSPLVVIIGPTAVGKTDIALETAKKLDGEIVSADSRLFYIGMDIGTAKPDFEQRAIIPHHLIDVSTPDQAWSLVDFQLAATAAIAGIHERRHLPFLVGGTGQYVRALIEGWEVPSQEPDLHLRTALENWGKQIGPVELFRRLALLDPEAASHIESHNLRRVVRALEVIFLTGRRFSDQKGRRSAPYSVCLVGLRRDRTELYQRIDQRIQEMLTAGLLQEVKGLLEKGYSSDLPTMSAIGYREIVSVLEGKMTLEEAVVQMKRLSRQFVRRQGNWFRESDPAIRWFDATSLPVNEIVDWIKNPAAWISK